MSDERQMAIVLYVGAALMLAAGIAYALSGVVGALILIYGPLAAILLGLGRWVRKWED